MTQDEPCGKEREDSHSFRNSQPRRILESRMKEHRELPRALPQVHYLILTPPLHRGTGDEFVGEEAEAQRGQATCQIHTTSESES